MNKVYILFNSWHCDGDSDSGIVAVYDSFEKAKAEMTKCVQDIIENDSMFVDGKPDDGVVVVDGEDEWTAYRDGDYLLDSCEYRITEEFVR